MKLDPNFALADMTRDEADLIITALVRRLGGTVVLGDEPVEGAAVIQVDRKDGQIELRFVDPANLSPQDGHA